MNQINSDEIECDACQGKGTIDETLGGEFFSDPIAECPNCDGRGYFLIADELSDEQILAVVKAAPALDTADAEWLHVARAAIAADRALRRVGVPDEWFLVPSSPTVEMQAAWDKAPFNEDTDVEFFGAYGAMMAAAPQPPAKP